MSRPLPREEEKKRKEKRESRKCQGRIESNVETCAMLRPVADKQRSRTRNISDLSGMPHETARDKALRISKKIVKQLDEQQAAAEAGAMRAQQQELSAEYDKMLLGAGFKSADVEKVSVPVQQARETRWIPGMPDYTVKIMAAESDMVGPSHGPSHPSADEHRQVTNEDDVRAWLETGRRPRSRSRNRSKSRTRQAKQEACADKDEQGPFQAVLDMHASTVEHLQYVTNAQSMLQEEYDKMHSQYLSNKVHTDFEEYALHTMEQSIEALDSIFMKIDDQVFQYMRNNPTPEDLDDLKKQQKMVEETYKKEKEELLARTAQDRKLAQQVPDVLKALDDLNEILDQTVSQREELKTDVKMLETKVGGVTIRAERAEDACEKGREREGELKEKVKQLTEENSDQSKSILTMQKEVAAVNKLRLELDRHRQDAHDAKEQYEEILKERTKFDIQVEKLTDQLAASQQEIRELNLHIMKSDMETRGIRENYYKVVDQYESVRLARSREQEEFADKTKDLAGQILACQKQFEHEEWYLNRLDTETINAEGCTDHLSQVVPDLLQNKKDEILRQKDKIESLNIKIYSLEEDIEALNRSLKAQEDENTALSELFESEKQKFKLKSLELSHFLSTANREAALLTYLPGLFDNIDAVLMQVKLFTATTIASKDETMVEIRLLVEQLQQREKDLQDANNKLTLQLNRLANEARNAENARIAIAKDRDTAKQFAWTVQKQLQEMEQELVKITDALSSVEVTSHTVLDVTQVLEATYYRQKNASATELETEFERQLSILRTQLGVAERENKMLYNSTRNLEKERDKLKAQGQELESKRNVHLKQLALTASQFTEMKGTMESLAGGYRLLLEAAVDYQQGAKDTCDELLAELEVGAKTMALLKKRLKKSSRELRKSKSPEREKDSRVDLTSWASFSKRKNESSIGSPRRPSTAIHTMGHQQRELKHPRSAVSRTTRIKSNKKRGGGESSDSDHLESNHQHVYQHVFHQGDDSRRSGPPISPCCSDLEIPEDQDDHFKGWSGDSISGVEKQIVKQRPSTAVTPHPASQFHFDRPNRMTSVRLDNIRDSSARSQKMAAVAQSSLEIMGECHSDPWGRPRSSHPTSHPSLRSRHPTGPGGVSDAVSHRPSSSSRLVGSVMQAREVDSRLIKSSWVSPAQRPSTAISRANMGFVRTSTASSRCSSPKKNRERIQSANSEMLSRKENQPDEKDHWGQGRVDHLWHENDQHRQNFEQQLQKLLGLPQSDSGTIRISPVLTPTYPEYFLPENGDVETNVLLCEEKP